MKNIFFLVILTIFFFNTALAEKITYENCNSNIPDSQNFSKKKLPFWVLIIQTNGLIGAEMREYEGVTDGFSKMKVQIAILKPDKNIFFGYGVGRWPFIYEYEFDLNKSSFIVKELTSVPDKATYKRIEQAIINEHEAGERFPKLSEIFNFIRKETESVKPLEYLVSCERSIM